MSGPGRGRPGLLRADLLVRNAGELLTLAGPAAPRTGTVRADVGSIRGGAVAAHAGRIVAAGAESDVVAAVELAPGATVVDAGGRLVGPGFVDSHTHPIFAGYREAEFNRILAGETYQDIARSGGGIRATVRATRKASDEELHALGRTRLDRMIRHGTTTAEAKSGYGLAAGEERRALEVIARLDREHPVDLVPTVLAAHAVPEEFEGRRSEFVDAVIAEILPATAGLARFCDVFCDPTAFDVDESRRILRAGIDLGLKPRLHADEFASSGGAELAAEVGAATADHLGGVSRAGIERLAASGAVAVLLPGTLFFLGERRYAPARDLMAAGVPVALGTDLNPGSSYTESMQIVIQLACLMMRMTVEEALVAATINAAASLGLAAGVGSLEAGKAADILVFDVPNRHHLVYHYGVNHVDLVIKEGRVVFDHGARLAGGGSLRAVL